METFLLVYAIAITLGACFYLNLRRRAREARPTIDKVIDYAVTLFTHNSVHFEGGYAEVVTASSALSTAVIRTINGDPDRAKWLFDELVDRYDSDLDYDNAAGGSVMDFVHALFIFSRPFQQMVIDRVPHYNGIVTERGRLLQEMELA